MRFRRVTRIGVPLMETPSHCSIGVLSDQSSLALPSSVFLADSSASQSDTSPRLLAASATAPPPEQS